MGTTESSVQRQLRAQREANLTLVAAGYNVPRSSDGLAAHVRQQSQGALLRLGKEQNVPVPDEDAAKARKLVASVIGQKVSELEATEIDEFIRDADYLPKDSPFTLAERILDLLITDRVAALVSEDSARIAESGASPSAGSALLRQATIADETDRRLTAAEEAMDRLEARLRADRERERQAVIDRETAEWKNACPWLFTNR